MCSIAFSTQDFTKVKKGHVYNHNSAEAYGDCVHENMSFKIPMIKAWGEEVGAGLVA